LAQLPLEDIQCAGLSVFSRDFFFSVTPRPFVARLCSPLLKRSVLLISLRPSLLCVTIRFLPCLVSIFLYMFSAFCSQFVLPLVLPISFFVSPPRLEMHSVGVPPPGAGLLFCPQHSFFFFFFAHHPSVCAFPTLIVCSTFFVIVFFIPVRSSIGFHFDLFLFPLLAKLFFFEYPPYPQAVSGTVSDHPYFAPPLPQLALLFF